MSLHFYLEIGAAQLRCVTEITVLMREEKLGFKFGLVFLCT